MSGVSLQSQDTAFDASGHEAMKAETVAGSSA